MTTRTRTLLLEEQCLARHALALLAPQDPTAIDEGRLFVGRRRIERPDERLDAGVQVTWNAPRNVHSAIDQHQRLVLELRNGIVAAAKPAAWSSEPDRTGSVCSLREQLARALRVEQLHIATRLDVGVSGLVLGATDAEARRLLAEVMVTGNSHRSYVAMAVGQLPDRGRWEGAVEHHTAGKSRDAITAFECIARVKLASNLTLGLTEPIETVSLLMLRPETGHRHQLRIHGSRAGAPLLGDRRYGGPHRFIDAEGRVSTLDRIYLHAITMTIPLRDGTHWHPRSPIPRDFSDFWLRLGGQLDDFRGIQE